MPLPLFCSARKQNNESLAIPPEVHAISRPKMYPQFQNTSAHRFHVREVSCRKPIQRYGDSRRFIVSERLEPPPEWRPFISVQLMSNSEFRHYGN